ncbi:MAG: AAA domain-containing protein [Armatimonadetes bacterium]|nr:AAA domain-containing protein [Armatimonadota bacterium]
MHGDADTENQATSETGEVPEVSRQASAVFRYLSALTSLRIKKDVDLNKYASDGQVIWMSDIPRERECHTAAWGATESDISDVWLEVRKPKITSYPPLPKSLSPWSDESRLSDSSDLPELLQSIPDPDSQADAEAGEPTAWLSLADHPELSETWDRYLSDSWLQWAEEDARAKRVQEVYARLHDTYLQVKREGELFELVVGIGLLTWRTPDGECVRRHVITAQATLEFEADRGIFTVRPASDGVRPTLEEDMLDPSDRPPRDIAQELASQVEGLGDNVFDLGLLDTVLSSWAHSVPGGSGSYSSSLALPSELTENPIVAFAPALILRKRNQRSLLALLNDITGQLETGIPVPPGIRSVVMADGDSSPASEIDGGPAEEPTDCERILFPLAANAKQREIVERLSRRQGVLVQGPPGTGKSHTIVNLVCHLLAQGKRILITSQTPRALQVLKGMFPPDLQALCVSVLGNDAGSLKELEGSVQGITNRLPGWDAERDRNKTQIASAEKKLDSLAEMEAQILVKLREIREKETYVHTLCDGEYSGTGQAIAERIEREQVEHGWLVGRVDADWPCPLSNAEAVELLGLCRELSEDIETAANQAWPGPTELPNVQEFSELCFTEDSALSELRGFGETPTGAAYAQLTQAEAEQLESLEPKLQAYVSKWEGLRQFNDPWARVAIEDIVSGRAREWQALHETTQEHLSNLSEMARRVNDCRLEMPSTVDRRKALVDASALLHYLESGGRIGILPFRSGAVRQARYIVKHCRVDGQACNNLESLSRFITCMNVDEHIDAIWSNWSSYGVRSSDTRYMQVGRLESQCQRLRQVLELSDALDQARNACSSVENLPEPAWHYLDEVRAYLRAVRAARARRAADTASGRLTEVEKAVSEITLETDCNPVTHDILTAVRARDVQSYSSLVERLNILTQFSEKTRRRDSLYAQLATRAPTLAQRIKSEAGLQQWDRVLPHLEGSWCWAKARTWLEENFVGSRSEQEIEAELNRVQDRIRRTTGELCALRAWRYCLESLVKNEPARRSLHAWAQEVRRVGRGTGRRAEVHRRAARENMDNCRDAIPAWIMPLYRVAETVRPTTGAYDVVIIDEASQSGPEALFLQFVAKKIVVVGDDKQISPVNVGVRPGEADNLVTAHLKELSPAIRTALSLDGSFFALAAIAFRGRIMLTEHFRCVPEIIEFSNHLFYDGDLEPVRQYPPERPKPAVIAVPVPSGYREGASENARNRPEAEALVEMVAKCCQDPLYRGRSMGVISLLNDNQARLIEGMLREKIGTEEMEKRAIICGNAYAFQGAERDVMFLSMVAAPGETQLQALTRETYRQRFNVAASRARDQMWLFHTPTVNDFRNHECLRYKLLSYCQHPVLPAIDTSLDSVKLTKDAENPARGEAPYPFDSWFEVDVYLKLTGRGYRVIPQFEVAGYRIDLVVEGKNDRLAVECDGDRWHSDPEKQEQDMLRERVLKRCLWKFWRVRGSEFYFNREEALKPLWDTLAELGIEPEGSNDSNGPEPSSSLVSSDGSGESSAAKAKRKRNPQCARRTQATLFPAPESVLPRKRPLDYTTRELEAAIKAVLSARPNNSCKRDVLTKEVCSYLNVVTRGAPRQEFEKRLSRALSAVKRRGVVKEYKGTKNVRVRLSAGAE